MVTNMSRRCCVLQHTQRRRKASKDDPGPSEGYLQLGVPCLESVPSVMASDCESSLKIFSVAPSGRETKMDSRCRIISILGFEYSKSFVIHNLFSYTSCSSTSIYWHSNLVTSSDWLRMLSHSLSPWVPWLLLDVEKLRGN